MSVPIRSVKVWINAFIPLNILGYTQRVPAGIHTGKTMIPGPNPLSDCYLTDQRDFSNQIHAKSRMHSEVKLVFSGNKPILTQWHNCDQTTELDCGDGDVESTKKGSISRMNFRLLPTSTSKRAIVSFNCSASNPCAPTSRIIGDIDYNGTLTIDHAARSVKFDGKIDQFPAFEAYATINDSAGITLFREPPPAGNTVLNLPLNANRSIVKTIIFP